MIIEGFTIGYFGGIEKRTIDLSSGITVICGNNESGKSRIAGFIKFMFYGFSGDPEERIRYTGSENGRASGTLDLSCPKGRFRIVRSVGAGGKGAPDESVTVIDLSINSPIRGNDPAAMFLGVSKELFERSAFMMQLQKRAVDSEQLCMAVENMLSSADESINAQKSADLLTEELIALEGVDGASGAIAACETECAEYEKRLTKALEDKETCRRLIESEKENGKKIESNEKELTVCQKSVDHTDALRRLEKLKTAREALKEKDASEERILRLKDTYTKNGFYPDRAYAKDLSELSARCQNSFDALSEMSEQKKKADGELASLPEPAKGKQGRLLDAIGDCRKKEAANKTRFIVFLSAAFLTLALAIVFFVSGKILPGVFFAVGALLCAGISVFFLIRTGKAKEEETELFESVGAKSREQLSDAVEKHAALLSRRETLKEQSQELDRRIAKERDNQESLIKEAAALAARWGKPVNDPESLEKTARMAQSAYEELSDAEATADKAKLQSEILGQTSGEEVKELINLIKTDGVKEELSQEAYKNCQMKIKFYTQTIDGLRKRVALQKEQLERLEKCAEDPETLKEELSEMKNKHETLKREAFVKRSARDAILETIAYMRDAILPEVTKQASAFFCQATNGAYTSVEAGGDFRIRVKDAQGREFSPLQLSGGTAELLYVSLRLSLTFMLFGGEPTLSVFDESFAHLDDLRKAGAFMALAEHAKEKRGQIILLTCHKRDAALLERITSFQKIEL